jgi:hypothetical protein
MMLAHRFAVVVGMIAVAVFLMLARVSFQDWFALDGLQGLWTGLHVDLSSFLASFGVGNVMLLVSGLGAVALLGGVVYVATDSQ